MGVIGWLYYKFSKNFVYATIPQYEIFSSWDCVSTRAAVKSGVFQLWGFQSKDVKPVVVIVAEGPSTGLGKLCRRAGQLLPVTSDTDM